MTSANVIPRIAPLCVAVDATPLAISPLSPRVRRWLNFRMQDHHDHPSYAASIRPWDLLVHRDDFRTTAIATSGSPCDALLKDGEVVLAIEKFALSSNTVTYASLGDELDYWRFFPSPPGWGRIPVWGYAQVTHSASDACPTGERFYGLFPMSSHVRARPRRNRLGFADHSAHRTGLSPVYNQYFLSAARPAPHEEERALLHPLFIASFLLDQLLYERDMFGARSVIISSASSKTAIGLACLLSERRAVRVIGLTSPANAAFVRKLEVYDEVVAYEDIPTLSCAAPAVYIDLAGATPARQALHDLLRDDLVYSCIVGRTHWEGIAGGETRLPGPRPQFFFVPDRIRELIATIGRVTFETRLDAAWQAYLPTTTRWLTLQRRYGAVAIRETFDALVAGAVAPDAGFIMHPGADPAGAAPDRATSW